MLPWWDVADFFMSSFAGRTEAWENTCQLASWIRPLKAVMADRQEVDSLLQLWGCPPTEYKDIFLTLWALLSHRWLKGRPPPLHQHNQSPFLSSGISIIFPLSYKHHRVTCKSFYILYNLAPIILPGWLRLKTVLLLSGECLDNRHRSRYPRYCHNQSNRFRIFFSYLQY